MTPVFGFNEMNEGKIDLMLSYDGSLLVTFLKHDDSEVPEGMSTYDYAQQVAAEECNVHLLEKLGANNTYSCLLYTSGQSRRPRAGGGARKCPPAAPVPPCGPV